MNYGSESIIDIETIYKSIPLGTKNYVRSIEIHSGVETLINSKTLSRIIANKTCRLIETYLVSKQHKRHISWMLDGDVLHINLPELPK